MPTDHWPQGPHSEELRRVLAPFVRFVPVRAATFKGLRGTKLHVEDFERLRSVAKRILGPPVAPGTIVEGRSARRGKGGE